MHMSVYIHIYNLLLLLYALYTFSLFHSFIHSPIHTHTEQVCQSASEPVSESVSHSGPLPVPALLIRSVCWPCGLLSAQCSVLGCSVLSYPCAVSTHCCGQPASARAAVKLSVHRTTTVSHSTKLNKLLAKKE